MKHNKTCNKTLKKFGGRGCYCHYDPTFRAEKQPMKAKVYETNVLSGKRREIAHFAIPADAVAFIDMMNAKGAKTFMIDYAGDLYPVLQR